MSFNILRRVALLGVTGLIVGGCEQPVAAVTGSADPGLVDPVRAAARPLSGGAGDYEPLLALTTGARVTFLGEGTHGTHEFYRERGRITRTLVSDQGYAAMLVEGDWTDAARVNAYVRGEGTDRSARQALGGFSGFPSWMWRNRDVEELVEWFRVRNAGLPAGQKASFYGLDLYGVLESVDEVLEYLQRVDPEAAREAAARYGCFAEFESPEEYGAATAGGETECAEEASAQFDAMQARADANPALLADEAFFNALQNARVVRNGERFYRVAYGYAGGSSWNVRDEHMAETVEAVLKHLEARGQSARVVAWAHNSHVGDARATSSGDRGELNVGQLVRARYGEQAVLVGFTTYQGTVIAADDWGEPGERKTVIPAHPESYEGAFHATGVGDFLLMVRGAEVRDELATSRMQRAIGVIYRPQTELESHYLLASVADQFDAVVHLDVTGAVDPL